MGYTDLTKWFKKLGLICIKFFTLNVATTLGQNSCAVVYMTWASIDLRKFRKLLYPCSLLIREFLALLALCHCLLEDLKHIHKSH